MPQFIIEFLSSEHSFGVFLLVTVAMGGGAAWLAGRAIALNWQPWWHVIASMLLLGAAVRFLHAALFEGRLLSPHYYLVDAGVCVMFGLAGFRLVRVRQMVTLYNWMVERSGPFHWRRRSSPGIDHRVNSG
jgi:hypothetical protein